MDTGSDKHLITSDLDFTISNDIEREKSVMSWRGYRHMFGLKVRRAAYKDLRKKLRCCWSQKVNQARCSRLRLLLQAGNIDDSYFNTC